VAGLVGDRLRRHRPRRDAYLADLDSLCQEADLVVTEAAPEEAAIAALDVQEAEFAALRSMRPSPDRYALHQEVMAMEWGLLQEARRSRRRIQRNPRAAEGEMERLAALGAPVSARYAQLGLPHCAA
jgi:hypothetical protein